MSNFQFSNRRLTESADMSSTLLEQYPDLSKRGVAREVTVRLPHGLHSRPSAAMAQLAQKFEASILLVCVNGEADAKSMLDILSLAITPNCSVIVIAHGCDETAALNEICNFLEMKPE